MQADSRNSKQTCLTGDVVIYKRGSQGRYFTKTGGFTLAIKQVISNVALYSIGLATGLDVSAKTVRKRQAAAWTGHSSFFFVFF